MAEEDGTKRLESAPKKTAALQGRVHCSRSIPQHCPMGSAMEFASGSFGGHSLPEPQGPRARQLMANSPFAKDASALLKEGKKEVVSKNIGKGRFLGGGGIFWFGIFLTEQNNPTKKRK